MLMLVLMLVMMMVMMIITTMLITMPGSSYSLPFPSPDLKPQPRRAAPRTCYSTAQSRASSTQRSHSPSITILPYNISALRPHTLNLGNHLNQIALQKFATNTMRTQSESQLCRTCRIKVSSSPSPRRVLSAVQCCVVLCSAVVEKG